MKSTSHGSCGSQERRAGQLFSKLTTSSLEDCSAMEYSLSSAAHVVLSTKREPVSALFAIREGEIRISINSRGDRRMSLRIATTGDIVNQKYPATSSSHGTRSPMRRSDGSLLGARQSKTNEIGRKRLGQADAHESDPTINPIRNRLHTTHKSRSR
jgi:hypothetical protein